MIPPCLTLSNIRCVSRVKWSNPQKGVVPSPTSRRSSYWKGSLLVTLDYGRQLTYFCCIAIMKEYIWMKNDHNSLFKNIYVFLFFRKELKLLWFVRQMDVVAGRQDRLLYWPITSSLDHSTLCYLQDPLSTPSASRSGLLNRRPGKGHRPQWVRSPWQQTGS